MSTVDDQTKPKNLEPKARRRLSLSFAVFASITLSACHMRGGEPSVADLSEAYRVELERRNIAGLDTLTFTPTGKTILVETKLDNLEILSCRGKDLVYVCEVKAWMRYPLQKMAETHKLNLTVFDGPEGWQFVKVELLDRLEWSK
jgi:hypothetical protein